VPLRRPSDFFGDSKNSLNSIQEEVSSAGSENALKIQGQFNQFKEDYKGVNNFVDTFETFKENVEKIDGLYEAVDLLKEDISSFASKEEVDSAIMSQLLFVEKSVDELKRNVKATNSKTIFEIKNNFQDLENSVNQFLSIDAPQHKRSLKESEIQVDKKLNKFKVEIDENFEFIQDQVSDKLTELSESLKGINQRNLSKVYERIEEVSGDLNNLLKKEFPKFNKVFVQSELKIEQKVNDIDSKINKVDDKIDTIESIYENRIESLRQAIDTFVEEEIPKYKKIIVESKLNSESEIKKLEDTLKERIEGFSGRFNLLAENNNSVLDDIKAESLVSREKIDSVSKTYENLYKDFKNREIYENKKLESFSEEIDSLKKTFNDDLESLSKDSKSDVENLYQIIETKILTLRQSLEENILSSEKSIREQDTNIEIIKVSLKNISNKIKEDIISETSSKLDKKISHLEKALNSLKETTFLKEEAALLTEQPSTPTKDPLTPLDKNFVTFEDLANHYRTFINRVQVQMASIGGGGETRLQYLDDIVGIATNASAYDGQFLKYDHSQGNFVFDTVGSVGAGGTWQVDSVGIHTTKNVGIGTTAKDGQALFVQGNSTFTGIITASSLSGYQTLVGTESSATKTFTVTVANKTSNHRYFGSGSSQGYFIDGVESPFITLLPGKTYRFDQADGSNGSHPLRFYLEANRTTQYTTNVTTNGTAGSAGAYTEITIVDTTPIVLHYQCSNHAGMGNAVSNDSNFIDTPYQITARSGINATGVVTATTFVGALTGNVTGNATGLSGTPNITVGSITASSATVSGNVSIAGTLTYEDVTNVDSLGIITARTGVRVDAGGLVVTAGVSTFPSVIVGGSTTSLVVNGDARITGILTIGTSSLTLDGNNNQIKIGTGVTIRETGSASFGEGLNITGVVTATSFSGDGSALTNISASQFVTTAAGIHTLSNVGIGTTNPTSKLTVTGNGIFTGVVTATTFVGALTGNATGLSGTPNITVGTIGATSLNASGVVTASSFSGAGTGLTGIPAGQLTGALPALDGSALQNITAGQVSGSGIVIKDEGTTIGTAGTINFVGAGISATFASSVATVTVSSSVSISTDAPASPSAGNLWYNSNLGRTFIYYNDGDSAQWVDAAPFNVGIITSLTNVSFSAGSATAPTMHFVGDSQTGFFSPSAGRITLVSVGSSILNVNPSGISVTGVVTATDFNSTSDISLKEHIHSIKDPLGKVLQINGVGFRWKNTKEDSIGVIAQDIEEVFPELVKNNDHIKTVNYNGLIGVLIEAVKEQQRQIEELKSIINK